MRRPRTAAAIALLALGPAAAPAPGQEPPPPPAPAPASSRGSVDDKVGADAFLRAKGLTPVGTVYVAEAEGKFEAMRGPLDESSRQFRDLLARLAQLETSGQSLRETADSSQRRLNDLQTLITNAMSAAATGGSGKSGNTPGQASNTLDLLLFERSNVQNQLAQANASYYRASAEYDQLRPLAAAKAEEVRLKKAAAESLYAEAGAVYRRLMVDPEVRQALLTLGRGTNKYFTLGPLDRFQQSVKTLAAMDLAAKGFQVGKKGGGLVLNADVDLKSAEDQARQFQTELRDELVRVHDAEHRDELRDKQIADNRVKETQLVAELAAAKTPLLEAQVRAIRDKVRKLVEEDAAADAERRKIARRVAARREMYVESLDLLARAEQAQREAKERLSHDLDVKEQMRALGQKKASLLNPTPAKAGKSFLDRANEDLVRDVVPLVPDRTGLWASATVNDVPVKRLAVNPSVETVILPSKTAALVGAVPDGRPPVAVTTADGKTYEARRATLKSVRVGTRTSPAEGVECLVFPPGYDAPPVLGASFFERYVAKVDSDAARLSLVEVNLAPAPAHGATRPAAKEHRPAAPAKPGGL